MIGRVPARRCSRGTTAFGATLALGCAFVLAEPAAARDGPEPCPPTQAPPAGDDTGPLEAQYFGTSTVLLRDRGTAVLVDGFFTRPPVTRWTRVAPDPAVIAKTLDRAGLATARLAAVFVTHAHYDHALDAPSIAWKTGADFVGSESSGLVARGADLPGGRIRRSGHCTVHPYSPFSVTAVASRHGRPFFFRGRVRRPLVPPAPVFAWREGGSLAFHFAHPDGNVLVHPGTNYVPGVYRGLRADVVFLSIAFLGIQRRGFAERYWCEVVRTTQARLVVPIHWDSFTQPITEELRPLLPREFARSRAIVEEFGKRDDVAIRWMRPFEPALDLRAAIAGVPIPPPLETGAGCSSEGPSARSARTGSRGSRHAPPRFRESRRKARG
ncbi:MAG: hypothetical protein QOI38_1808 [Sphingomonadales bacterium]|nr:hypothetical protein [Sphingomonadales bacterium]